MGSSTYRAKGFRVPRHNDYFVPIPRGLTFSDSKPVSYTRRSQPALHARTSAS
ncbi:hypothetical protein [Gilliamella sp. Nev5-1]|uniref:hypothetical protein n=1 Tax=Gilliamella sp. Nev5-1 TaxID=3120251 RepID=UPI0015CF5A2B|nr:hypothetical protein [Gilliamella apicola]